MYERGIGHQSSFSWEQKYVIPRTPGYWSKNTMVYKSWLTLNRGVEPIMYRQQLINSRESWNWVLQSITILQQQKKGNLHRNRLLDLRQKTMTLKIPNTVTINPSVLIFGNGNKRTWSFSANRSFLLRKRMMLDLSKNGLLQIPWKSKRASLILPHAHPHPPTRKAQDGKPPRTNGHNKIKWIGFGREKNPHVCFFALSNLNSYSHIYVH